MIAGRCRPDYRLWSPVSKAWDALRGEITGDRSALLRRVMIPGLAACRVSVRKLSGALRDNLPDYFGISS